MAAKLGDFIEFNQIEKTLEKLDDDDDFSVEKCIDVVDAIEDLTDEQKADTNELFQYDMKRQIFMKRKMQMFD